LYNFSQGKDKMAGYWLGAFFNPSRLIGVVVQVRLTFQYHVAAYKKKQGWSSF